jgi:ubiquitin-conjugating enzyme E2 J2
MLTEEMTTGSEGATWDNRVQRAKLSHAWNIKQKRFRDAFPEVCASFDDV